MEPKKCLPTNHLRSAESLCKDCLIRVCSKCFIEHVSHDIVDFEDYLETLVENHQNQIHQLEEALSKRNQDRDETVSSFNDDVKSFHDKQLETISNHFKELRKLLETKEMDLTNELNSKFEQNQIALSTYHTSTDKSINSSREFIEKFREWKFSNNSDNGELDLKMASEFHSNLKALTSAETNSHQYPLYSLKEHLKSIDAIKRMNVAKSYSITLPSKGKSKTTEILNTFYSFGGSGVEKINLESGEYKKILPFTHGNVGPTSLQFLWHNTVVDQVMYLFEARAGWKMDTKLEEPKWVKLDFEGDSSCSAVYDGKDSIYIFTGNGYGEGTQEIYKFDIHSETFVKVGDKLVNSTYLNVAYSANKDVVYLIGGYNSNDSWLSRVDQFDCKTHEIKNVFKLESIVSSGIYVDKQNLIYATTWSNKFVKIDMESGITTYLAHPIVAVSNYSKLFEKGNDFLNLVVEGDRSIHQYDTVNNVWTVEQLNLENSASNSNYIAISDI